MLPPGCAPFERSLMLDKTGESMSFTAKEQATLSVPAVDHADLTGVGRLVDHINKIVDFSIKMGANISGIALLVSALITCYEIFARYVFHSPTHWTFDLSVYLLLWFCYGSMAYVQRADRHVAVDLLVSHFPVRTKLIWDLGVYCLYTLFAFIVLCYGYGYAYESFSRSEFSMGMWKVAMWPAKTAIPVGCLLLLLMLIKNIILNVHTLRTGSPDKGTGIFSKPLPMMIIFFAAAAAAVYLLADQGLVGVVVLMGILLISGLPIFPSLGLAGIAGVYFLFGQDAGLTAVLPSTAYRSLESFSLVCLPLYILVGQVLEAGGVGEEIYQSASKCTSGLPGGEAIATVLACSVFAAISTSSVATAATIGLIALPALALRNYNKEFSYGLLAAGGTLGIMIPPSGSFIIYSAVTDESLGKLFIAGIIPGLIISSCFILYSVLYCKKSGHFEGLPTASLKERLFAVRDGMWGLLAPLIIMGGMLSGIFTPLEAGAVAALYVIAMVLIRGKLKLSKLMQVLRHSTLNGTMVLSIIVGALLLGRFMTMMRVPNMALDWVISMHMSKWGVLASVIVLMTVLGCFLEVVSVMMITLPVIYPIMTGLGFDGVWFAVIVTLTMEMALLTPPVGLNLYVISGVAKAPLVDVVKGMWPFFMIMVACIILLILFPQLSLWLPNLLVH